MNGEATQHRQELLLRLQSQRERIEQTLQSPQGRMAQIGQDFPRSRTVRLLLGESLLAAVLSGAVAWMVRRRSMAAFPTTMLAASQMWWRVVRERQMPPGAAAVSDRK
jgi:hypothetical protein